MIRTLIAFLGLTSCLLAMNSCTMPPVDPDISCQVNAISAIDNHAHPVLLPPFDTSDRDFDALPTSSLEAQSDPVVLRRDFPLLQDAWKSG